MTIKSEDFSNLAFPAYGEKDFQRFRCGSHDMMFKQLKTGLARIVPGSHMEVIEWYPEVVAITDDGFDPNVCAEILAQLGYELRL